ncbi:MAG TPA: hypothetical protein VF746_28975 [Longimicrobium sp.]|jgi:hypothetical protein
MKIEPSGVILTGVCEIQTAVCKALTPAPITAVWAHPGRLQINVCSSCLDEKVRQGDWEIPGARIRTRSDVAVYDQVGTLQLVVEVKSARGIDQHGAAQVYRNLLAHSGIPGGGFFLLVGYPSDFYLWVNRPSSHRHGNPDYEFRGEELLRPYMESGGEPGENGAGHGYERTVAQWLDDLVQQESLPPGPAFDWLIQSGLFEAIRGGTVLRQAPVPV